MATTIGLRPVPGGQPRHQVRVRERGAVQRHLVRAGVERRLGVSFGTDAAADSQWNEELGGDRAERVRQRAAVLDRRGDVQDHELVDAFGVVAARQGSRVAGVREVFELHALDDAPSRTSRHAIRRLESMVSFGNLGIWRFGNVHESAEDTEAGLRGLFRVKLHAEHVVALDRGGESDAVFGRGRPPLS